MFLAKLAEKVEPEPASGLLTDTVRPSGVRSVTQKPGFLNQAKSGPPSDPHVVAHSTLKTTQGGATTTFTLGSPLADG